MRATPRLAISSVRRPTMVRPPTRTSPLRGRYRPVMTLNAVDFPEPFGPIKPRISPALTRSEKLSSACTPPKLMETWSSSSAGSPFDGAGAPGAPRSRFSRAGRALIGRPCGAAKPALFAARSCRAPSSTPQPLFGRLFLQLLDLGQDLLCLALTAIPLDRPERGVMAFLGLGGACVLDERDKETLVAGIAHRRTRRTGR